MVTTATPRSHTPAPPSRPLPPAEAGSGRRVLHTAIAIAGWVLFVYWWFKVLGTVSSAEVRFTGIFIAVTAVVVVALTAIWAIHNRLIFKRKGARTQVREVKEDYSRDRLGRHLHFAGSPDALKTDPIVLIRLEHEGKTYRPSSAARRTESGPFTVTNRIAAHEPR